MLLMIDTKEGSAHQNREIPNDLDRRFGGLLRRARQAAGLSLRELGRASGLDATHLSRIERGLVRPPKGPKRVALIRHLPSSPLAKAFEVLEGGKVVRTMVAQSAQQILDLLLGLRKKEFQDRTWCAAVLDVLESCIAIIEKKMPRNEDPTRERNSR